MKRAYAILISLLLPLGAAAQNVSCPRFTFGAEWGYIGIFYSGYHHNFYAPEGYRADPREYGFTYASNAEAYLHAGYNISPCCNLSVYAGISAIEDYHHTIPLSLRFTRYSGDEHMKDRWFSFIDLGSGFSIKRHPQSVLTGKVGGGYRVSLSRDTKLDFLVAYRMVLTHPDIEYYGVKIPFERINRNNAYVSAFSLGIALTL